MTLTLCGLWPLISSYPLILHLNIINCERPKMENNLFSDFLLIAQAFQTVIDHPLIWYLMHKINLNNLY